MIFNSIINRISDWLLERDIRLWSRKMFRSLMLFGVDSLSFQWAAIQYDKLASQRSPQQLARMKGRGE